MAVHLGGVQVLSKFIALDIGARGNQNGAMSYERGGGKDEAAADQGAGHATRLARPVTPRDHIRGRDEAPVTLVEYGDFECPYCGIAASVVRQLQQRFGDDLRFVFRANPRSHIFPHAEKAAEAAEAAAVQGRFWEMHDLLFANQRALEDADLIEYARRLGLDVPRFTSELRSGAHHGRVHDQEVGGWPSHVISTPTFFVNGVRFEDRPDVEGLGAAIARARDAARSGASRSSSSPSSAGA